VFDVNNLDLMQVGRAFGFTTPPAVTLNVKVNGRTVRRRKVENFRRKKGKGNHF
jgi:hypothetical protein